MKGCGDEYEAGLVVKPGPTACWDFTGVKVLVVEDHYVIADELRRLLVGFGAVVVGPAGTLGCALSLVQGTRAGGAEPDVALLDVNLHGVYVFPVADVLARRGIPFAFLSGYARASLPEAYRQVPQLEKPARRNAVAGLLFGLAQQVLGRRYMVA